MNARATTGAAGGATWYRQPVVWLAATLLVAALAGCVAMIVLGLRYADEPLPLESGQVFKVPRTAPPAAEPAEAVRP